MRAALLACALLASAAVAAAQEPGSALGPCQADAARLCADAPAGHGAKMKCLSEHQADLSVECRERISAVKARVAELAAEIEKACGEDGKKLCPDHALGAGLVPCLAAHEKDLSGSCREWLNAHRSHGEGGH